MDPSCSACCAQLIADDKRAPPGLLRWLRLRARLEAHGRARGDITDLCRDLGISRVRFYTRTTALALRVVAVLNARENTGGHVESPLAPRCSNANQAS